MLLIVESKLFTKLIGDYLTDEEYAVLQMHLARNPTAGAVIPKSGGARVIYYLRTATQIGMLTVYAKSEEQNIPAHILKQIKKAMEDED